MPDLCLKPVDFILGDTHPWLVPKTQEQTAPSFPKSATFSFDMLLSLFPASAENHLSLHESLCPHRVMTGQCWKGLLHHRPQKAALLWICYAWLS